MDARWARGGIDIEEAIDISSEGVWRRHRRKIGTGKGGGTWQKKSRELGPSCGIFRLLQSTVLCETFSSFKCIFI